MAYSWRKGGSCFVAVLVMSGIWTAPSQAADPYKLNIIEVTNTAPGQFPTVKFSVTNTATNQLTDLQTDPAWTALGGASRLFFQIGWDTRDFTNTNSLSNTVPGGRGAAMPIPVNALGPSVIANGDGTYRVTSPLPIPTTASGTGEVAMEGHPAGQDANGNYTVRIPVKSVYKYFTITDTSIVPRRRVVDVNKCMVCHKSDGTGVAPRLTLHGNNRTEEPQVCVVCHNPNNTDIPYRLAADPKVVVGGYTYPEQSLDFKRLVHGIHASSAGFRENPLVVIGFNHSVFDASTLTPYPASLKDCLRCHIDNGTKGTFELPLGSNVLGSTSNTRSINPDGSIVIDTDPLNDEKITPTAAVCSSCHDEREDISHMIETGRASFSTTQAAINSGLVRERCVNCHGPGREKSVRKVHLKDDDDD